MERTARWPLAQKEGSRSHDEQTCHHRTLISHPVNDPGRRYREDEICPEKRELNEHHLGIVEIKNRFQVRHENIVQTSKKAPHKKQRGYNGEGSPVTSGRLNCS